MSRDFLERRSESFSGGGRDGQQYQDFTMDYVDEFAPGAPGSYRRTRPMPLPTPTRASSMVSPIQNLLPSAPASPPTPAPSPTPQLNRLPTWATAGESEDTFLRDVRPHFSRLDSSEKQRFLAEVLNLCDSQQLSFVMNYVSPRLKKDPFKVLPHELCLRVSAFSFTLLNSRDKWCDWEGKGTDGTHCRFCHLWTIQGRWREPLRFRGHGTIY